MAEDGEIIDKNWISREALAAPLTLTKNLEPLIKALELFSGDVKSTVAVIKDQKASMGDVNQAVQQLTRSEAELIATQKKVVETSQNEQSQFARTDVELKKLQQDFAKLRTENERNTKEGKKLLDTIQQQTKEIKKLEQASRDAAKRSKELGDQFGALDSVTGGWLGNLKKIGNELLTLARNPFFIALTAVTGIFLAAKSAADAYYTATLEGEEELALAQAKDKAFVSTFEKAWEETGGKIAKSWETLKDRWREIFQTFEDSETAAKQKKALEEVTDIETRRAELAKEHLRDRLDDANTELKVLELLEDAKSKEEFTAKQRLQKQLEGNKILKEQEKGDLKLALDDLNLQRSIVKQLSDAKGGVYDQTKSILSLTSDEIRAIKVKGEEVAKLFALEEAYVRIQVAAEAKAISRKKLELSLIKEVADEEEKSRAFRTQMILRLYEDQKKPLEELKELSAEQTSVEVRGAEERIDAAKRELDAKVEFVNKYARARGEEMRLEEIGEGLSQVLGVYNEFYSALGNLQATFTANQQQDLKAQTDALQQQKDNELKIAGDNAEAKRIIEEKYVEKDKLLKREQAKALNKQAKFEKATALIQAAISESQLILKALLLPTPTNIAAAIAGGIQIAAIASKEPPPLPAYRKGTASAKGGLAIVGEEGSELVEKSGRAFLTPARPTVMDIPKGAKVSTHAETMRRLAQDGLGRSYSDAPVKSEIAGLKASVDKQTKVLQGKEFVKVEITEKGVRLAIQQAARKEYRLGSLYK